MRTVVLVHALMLLQASTVAVSLTRQRTSGHVAAAAGAGGEVLPPEALAVRRMALLRARRDQPGLFGRGRVEQGVLRVPYGLF